MSSDPSSESFSSSSHIVPSPLSPSCAAKAKQALRRIWDTLLSFLKRVYVKSTEQDVEVEPKHFYPFLLIIDEQGIKGFMLGAGISMLVPVVYSGSAIAHETAIKIVASITLVNFTTVLVGHLLRKNSTKWSFLFTVAGMGLLVIEIAAILFFYLNIMGLKWIPVICAVVIFLLAMPFIALLSFEKKEI
ncbi:hypothetical protein L6164_001850 [Bauhinia variegata]|uniref:Uncharacterized protein n=1 Tax=Bauhinia variegata TaxID=167791 RepID=A0ACB9QI99_BAUVA|nr:hypothetical protein L6164_001850 [Bauhinia variegata]